MKDSIIKNIALSVENIAKFGSDSPSLWFSYEPKKPDTLKSDNTTI